MKIVINNHRKIFAIQDEFNFMFPGLKVVFFAKPSKPGGPPSETLVRDSSKTLQECRTMHREGTIEILPTMNISDLKANLRDIFGLSIEIFQNAGNAANENPVGDQFTIGEINRQYSV